MPSYEEVSPMSDDQRRQDDSYFALDASAGLYHEPQADGVPYDEELEPFSREHQKQARR